MNICFVANYNKTIFFNEVSNILSKNYNINTYWIVVNKQNRSLLEEQEQNGRVLYLPKSIIRETKNDRLGEFKLNELVYNDRILKFNKKNGVRYLTSIQKPIYEFIKNNNVEYVFGELTWAHELLILRLINHYNELNCKYLNPHTVRIPNGRFAFFVDEFQSQLHVIQPEVEDLYDLEKYFIPKKPEYLALNDAILKKKSSIRGRLNRLKRLLTSEGLDQEDITLPDRWTWNRFLTPILDELRKETYKFLSKVDLEFVKDKMFIFLTLHKQPEASVDVLGRYYEDQQQLIKNIWRQLPDNWWLVVKEHTNAVGDRPLSFYKDLQKFEKLVFIDEKVDSYKLLECCQAVVTISGTVAYEAALLKKRALVFSDVFFAFSYIKKISLEDLKDSRNLLEIIDSIPNKDIDDFQMKKHIYVNSFEGTISDPVSNPRCMDEENINNVSKAIFAAIK